MRKGSLRVTANVLMQAALIVCLCTAGCGAKREVNGAPEITMTQVLARYPKSGPEEPLSLKGLRGKVVLLQFFGASSPTSKLSLRAFDAMQGKYAPKQLVSISIAHDPVEEVQRFLEQVKVEHIVGWDEKGQTFKRYQVRFLPWLVVIDKEGSVAWEGDTRYFDELPERLMLKPLLGLKREVPEKRPREVEGEIWETGCDLVELRREGDRLEIRWPVVCPFNIFRFLGTFGSLL